jgi:hypothetical protein
MRLLPLCAGMILLPHALKIPAMAQVTGEKLPQLIQGAIRVHNQHMKRLSSGCLLKPEDVVFIQDETAFEALVETITAYLVASPPESNSPDMRRLETFQQVSRDLRERAAFTLDARPPIIYNGLSDRWKQLIHHRDRGHRLTVLHALAADLVHESQHACGIRDEAIACRAQLEFLTKSIRCGIRALETERKTVMRACDELRTSSDRFGKVWTRSRSGDYETKQMPVTDQ